MFFLPLSLPPLPDPCQSVTVPQTCAVCSGVPAVGSCSVSCGSGFQSRRVDCVHLRTGRTLAQQHCAWIQRPPTWQPCSNNNCSGKSQGECRDSSQYCSVILRLRLCHSPTYKHTCCQTCSQDLVST
ncbi:hypothetical protein WMY93_013135 [Mugilogobius chulae]|uniref:PLAC domain-containing protein n=1 Tax=Mugilogobius chulae TaxID=88201 RepID=A0AAW0PAN5_9GOBI